MQININDKTIFLDRQC